MISLTRGDYDGITAFLLPLRGSFKTLDYMLVPGHVTQWYLYDLQRYAGALSVASEFSERNLHTTKLSYFTGNHGMLWLFNKTILNALLTLLFKEVQNKKI